MQQRRFNWITAIKQSIQPNSQLHSNLEASFSKEDQPVTYQKVKISRRPDSMLYRKSLRVIPERRFSTPISYQIPDNEIIEQNPSYYNSQRACQEKYKFISQERKADDSLPSLPVSTECTADIVYDEIQDFAANSSYPTTIQCANDDNESGYDDIVQQENLNNEDTAIKEEQPPPIPPKLRARQSVAQDIIFSQMISSEDEEGYVSVTQTQPAEEIDSQPQPLFNAALPSTTPDDEASVSLDSQNSVTVHSTMSTAGNTSVPILTYSSEESPLSFISDNSMDPVEHARLLGECNAHISLGSLSSLEPIKSPCSPHGLSSVENYFHILYHHPSREINSPHHKLSPLHESESGSDSNPPENKGEIKTPLKEATNVVTHHQTEVIPVTANKSPLPTSDSTSTCTTTLQPDDFDLHPYDKLQHWTSQAGNKDSVNFSHSPPPRQKFDFGKLRERKSFTSPQHNPTSPQRSFLLTGVPLDAKHSSKRDPLEIQTCMLEKMQQALEAMQAAYAYMPYMSPEAEIATTIQQTKFSDDEPFPEQYNPANESVLSSTHEDVIKKPEDDASLRNLTGQEHLLESQALMEKCLSKFSESNYRAYTWLS